MNIYIGIMKIIEQPTLLRHKNTALSQIILAQPSIKKRRNCFSLKAIAKGKMAKMIFENYRKNDIVMIEGFIYIKKISVVQQDKNKTNRTKKCIAMKIQKIHSASILSK